ncbi:MAG: hypothetical protein FWH21_06675, partial [Kiritimatiellaeota bacterium]|nr:hypothetical protein [Kiritimatiellota bacterium]
GMRLKEASRWDAMIFFAFSSTERNIPNGMLLRYALKVISLYTRFPTLRKPTTHLKNPWVGPNMLVFTRGYVYIVFPLQAAFQD